LPGKDETGQETGGKHIIFFVVSCKYVATFTDMEKMDSRFGRLREIAGRIGILHARDLPPPAPFLEKQKKTS